jgi:hypothetical protein
MLLIDALMPRRSGSMYEDEGAGLRSESLTPSIPFLASK